MVKFGEELAEIAAKGVIGGRGGEKSNTGHPGGPLVVAVVCGAGGPGKIFRSIGARNRRFGQISAIVADFSQNYLAWRV